MDNPETWKRVPDAERFFEDQFRAFALANPLIAQLEDRFLQRAGVRMQSLVDHWIFPEDAALQEIVERLGLTEIVLPEGDRVWKHLGARLPVVRFKKKRQTPCLALLTENISLFAEKNGLVLEARHGEDDSAYQCAHLTLENGELMPIIRQGYAGYAPGTLSESQKNQLAELRARFANRNRIGTEADVIAQTQSLIMEAIDALGQGRAVDEFFLSERNYYMTRNYAARWQYARQQEIGIGWANHDHHTYRSSRASFRALIRLFHSMGFVSRERFYAGAEAGWGAQVLEHPISRIVLFSDVDMAPEELSVDYANVELAPRESLATIGLWCALHTSSIAKAGLHHLECEYAFDTVESLLKANGIGVMPPFTDLPMLKQAFTAAELWRVDPERLEPLVSGGQLSTEQAERFQNVGAAGSHLEILQRWEGFKGFNKTGVSAIIRDTDARRSS